MLVSVLLVLVFGFVPTSFNPIRYIIWYQIVL